MTTAIVEMQEVHKAYGRVQALIGLDLTLQSGEVLGLLGHNGAGKTTTMKLILGVVPPSAGTVQVFGRPPLSRHANHLRLRLGYLPESVTFYEQLSGREVLDYFARLKRAPVSQVDQLLQRVDLADAAQRRVRTYSKGMRQRLGLAQALLGDPKLLLLDEPTAGLDPMATRQFFAMIDELRRDGVSIILSSHMLPGVERHIDRAAILSHGRLAALGSLTDLRRRAGLPLLIRVHGHFGEGQLQQRLQSAGVHTRNVNGHQIVLEASSEAKLAALRVLLDNPSVDDVELEPPSLEAIYAHFDAMATEQDKRQ